MYAAIKVPRLFPGAVVVVVADDVVATVAATANLLY